MARRRLGVVLLLPQAVALEVDGLRRACGDADLGRIPPHLTLVPPVNVRVEDVDAALGVVRAAAATEDPLRLALGPVGSFLPDTPVLRLGVAGEDLDALHRLRAALMTGPLARETIWDFVPHVTLADGLPAGRIDAAVQALADWSAEVEVGALHVLEQEEDRVWRPIAEAALGGPGGGRRGGLPIVVETARMVDADVVAAVGPVTVVVTARLLGRPVGVAVAVVDGEEATLVWVRVDGVSRRIGIGRRLLTGLEAAVGAHGARSMNASSARSDALGAALRGAGYVPGRAGFDLLRRRLPGSG